MFFFISSLKVGYLSSKNTPSNAQLFDGLSLHYKVLIYKLVLKQYCIISKKLFSTREFFPSPFNIICEIKWHRTTYDAIASNYLSVSSPFLNLYMKQLCLQSYLYVHFEHISKVCLFNLEIFLIFKFWFAL